MFSVVIFDARKHFSFRILPLLQLLLLLLLLFTHVMLLFKNMEEVEDHQQGFVSRVGGISEIRGGAANICLSCSGIQKASAPPAPVSPPRCFGL